MKVKCLRSTNDTQYGYLKFGAEFDMEEGEKLDRWLKRKIVIEVPGQPKAVEEKQEPKKVKEAVETVAEEETKEISEEKTVEEETKEETVAEEISGEEFEKLKELAKEMKIPYYKQMKPETLKAKIEELTHQKFMG